MKILTLLATLLLPMFAYADTITVDPNIKRVQILNCALPTERADNDPLDVSEILKISWYIGTEAGDYSTKTDTGICQITIDITQYQDGEYFIAATASDLDLRESIISPESVMLVKRQAPPAQMAAPAFVQ